MACSMSLSGWTSKKHKDKGIKLYTVQAYSNIMLFESSKRELGRVDF